MTDIIDPGTINNGDTPDWDLVQAYFDAIYDVINSPGELTNANIDPAAAIAYSKLNLSNSIVAGDIASGAVGAAELDAIPVCVLAQASNVANANTTAETWATEATDTDGMHSTSVNTSRITIQTAGVYRVQASAWYDGTLPEGETCAVSLRLSGTEIGKSVRASETTPVGSGAVAYVEIDATFACAASSYFEVVYSHSGLTSLATKRFSAVYIGASA